MDNSIDLSLLPQDPGIYRFKDENDTIIYIGKAKNLKKRVSSYFAKIEHDAKTQVLIENIRDYDFIVTDSEREALILEANLIKKHKPKFNIDLKDSKRYAYLQITNEKFPRLLIARSKEKEGKYYGPFTSAVSRDHVLFLMKKIFKLRTCKKIPKKPCLRHQIGLCEAPCIGGISEIEYNKKIDSIKMVLLGKTGKLIKILEKEMKKQSGTKNFEKALEMREQISALKDLKEKQKMERGKFYNEDILNYIVHENTVYLMLFNVDKGTIINRQEFVFPYTEDFFEEFILQYYSNNNNIPRSIVLPIDIGPALLEVLNEKRKGKVIIEVPKIGEKKALLDLILKNIQITYFSAIKEVEDLKKALLLDKPPFIIECFDISHLSGTSLVGSMVQFRNGSPDKNNYRRFKIKSFLGNDDTKAIAEVVMRRYYKLKTNFERYPDLIVIDGGKGQLNSALDVLERLQIKIPVISLAKKEEEVFVPGKKGSIYLDRRSDALKLLQKIRDEAHRFAINYNKLLRKKEMIG